MSGRKPFLEALDHIWWCDHCNVPLIAEKCGICAGTGRKVYLSPPGDVRPCSAYERDIIKSLFLQDFGVDLAGDRLMLLNKIPGEDKADEVILDGHVIAVALYDIVEAKYKLDLRLEGAKLLLAVTDKKTIRLNVSKDRHLSGKGVKSDAIAEASQDIKKNDIVLVRISERLTGFGTARSDYPEIMKPSGEGVKIRKVSADSLFFNTKVSTMDDAVRANKDVLRSMEKNAINSIRGVSGQKEYRKMPVTVSFSGGKDSLVVFNIARKAVKQLEAFFIDTGLEFPETVEYVKRYAEKTGVNIVTECADQAFDENFPSFGPPAKDYRWCCKVCKLGPVSSVLSRYKDGCITIDGKRRYESFQRGSINTVEKNPFVPGQISVFPIKDWRALEVWLYISLEELPFNPLYSMGFERIGCWLCPAALQAEFVRMKELHPGKFEEWQARLYGWAGESGLSKDFVDLGFWRWKSHPNKMLNIAKERNIRLIPEMKKVKTSLNIIRGISPCVAGGYSIEGVLRTENAFSPEDVVETLKTIGEPVYSEDLGVILVKARTGTAKVFPSGHVYATSNDKAAAVRLFEDTVKQLLRASICAGCGICVKACRRGAIKLGTRVKVDGKRCDRCGKCTAGCVVARYYDRLAPGSRKV